MSNVHPWFANVTVESSAAWTTQFFKEQNVDVANALPNRPTMYIAETGECSGNQFLEQDLKPLDVFQDGQQYVYTYVLVNYYSHWQFQKSSDAGNANNGASAASEENLQTFLDTFVCQANSAGIGYFFFEFCDEDWKDKQFGGVEGWWGLFNQK